jgi:predicted SnoaL-like aldol condensation-catalyzing enzyme
MKIISTLLASLALLLTTPVFAADAQGETNKKIVLAFYEAALIKMDVDLAMSYLGTKYIQHNPTAPDGAGGVKGLIQFLKEKFPERTSSIKRVMADGDLVMLHVHAKSKPEDRGTAIVDIFRVENGKIVEHWDVMQPVPEKAANANTMF